MNNTEPLRRLPSVDQLLREESTARLLERYPRQRVVRWIRMAINACREDLRRGDLSPDEDLQETVIDAVETFRQRDFGQAMRQVINATGVVLHTNLGRAPLSSAAIQRMQQATRYVNVELDLHHGHRCKRGDRVATMIAELVDAEDAVIVNNCAAATMLVLQAIAAGRKVIVSRGQLVEIGGGFRLPDVFRSAGVELCEVGTTNRTYLHDYESALDLHQDDEIGAIIRVHRSNFQLTGFVTEPTIDQLASIERPDGVAVIDDLGSGCMQELTEYGLDEPTVPASVRAGADLTLFSGDKLFGGPQCGLIVGKARWINQLRQSPLMRAMRIDKLTLAALEATTEIHLNGSAEDELPVLKMIAIDEEILRHRCEELHREIGSPVTVDVVACQSPVGGGSVPGASRPSFALRFSGGHAHQLAKRLRLGTPAVQPRIVEDAVYIDLRTVGEDELMPLASRIREAMDGTIS